MDKMRNSQSPFTKFVFSEKVSALGIRVIGGGRGYRTWHPTKGHGRWSMATYAAIYLIDGFGTFESESFKKNTIAPGDIAILFPDEVHYYSPTKGNDWSEYWIVFDGPTIRGLEKQGVLNRTRPLYHPGIDEDLIQLYRQAIASAQSTTKKDTCLLVFQILYQIIKQHSYHKIPSVHPTIHDIVERLRHEPIKRWDLKALAAEYGISYAKLRKDFPLYYSTSPHQFLLRERMKCACTYLVEGNSIKATCQMTGMEDPYYFSRLFKKFIGVAPREYVKTIRNWQ